MEGKHVVGVILISTAVSLGVTLAVMAYAMRSPLPLIDTARSRAVFDTAAGQKAA